jgi:hypothetical protein
LILSFDPARKREIFASGRKRADATGDMTMAARNRRIESKDDLDSLLEAWLRLGVIDESGDLNGSRAAISRYHLLCRQS